MRWVAAVCVLAASQAAAEVDPPRVSNLTAVGLAREGSFLESPDWIRVVLCRVGGRFPLGQINTDPGETFPLVTRAQIGTILTVHPNDRIRDWVRVSAMLALLDDDRQPIASPQRVEIHGWILDHSLCDFEVE